jgi:hypothetical protein
MKLAPFLRVDDMPFEASEDDVVRARGEPAGRGRNDVGLNELDYGDVVYRFQDCGRLEEVTMQALVVDLGTIAVPFGALAAFVREHDAASFERAGFVVSPASGLASAPREAPWDTALARHCIAQWRAL